MLCGGNVQQFCALTSTVFIWYLVGFFGSAIVCLGLVQFMASSAANYAHLNQETRHCELEEVLYAETGAGFANHNSQLPLCQFNYNHSGNEFNIYGEGGGGGGGGTLLSRKLPPAPQQPVRLRSQKASQPSNPLRYYAAPVGAASVENFAGAATNLRRTSYHASQNGWINTLY